MFDERADADDDDLWPEDGRKPVPIVYGAALLVCFVRPLLSTVFTAFGSVAASEHRIELVGCGVAGCIGSHSIVWRDAHRLRCLADAPQVDVGEDSSYSEPSRRLTDAELHRLAAEESRDVQYAAIHARESDPVPPDRGLVGFGDLAAAALWPRCRSGRTGATGTGALIAAATRRRKRRNGTGSVFYANPTPGRNFGIWVAMARDDHGRQRRRYRHTRADAEAALPALMADTRPTHH